MAIFLLSVGAFAFVLASNHIGTNKLVVVNAKYYAYVSNVDHIELNNTTVVNDIGFCYELVSNKPFLLTDDEVLGKTIQMYGNENELNRVMQKLGVMIEKRYVSSGVDVYEGYLKNNVNSASKIQIAYQNNTITIGFPVILGAY